MSMPLHIFLDLDLVLVDVFPLWKQLWINQIAQRLSLQTDEVRARGTRIWERGDLYTLEKHLRVLHIDPKRETWAKELQTRFKERLRAGAINYVDTSAFLDALARYELPRSIITFGDREYQRLKVEGLGRADGFFQSVHYTSALDEKAIVLKRASLSERIVFLDDSADEHTWVAVIAPNVHRIQIRRSDDIRHSQDAHHVVSDLGQALEVILSLKNNQPKESR